MTEEAPNEEGKSAIEDEDDYTGYFLEPTANSVNIVERIAEANRKLYEEDCPSQENFQRPKKVQFSESLINFEPENDESDDTGNTDDEKTEESEKEDSSRRPKTAGKEPEIKEDEIVEEIKPDTGEKEEISDSPQQVKVLLVMLPRERSSSCESVIGEEIAEEKAEVADKKKTELKEKVVESVEAEKSLQEDRTPTPCKVSKIPLELVCSPKVETKNWRLKQGLKCKKPKKGNETESRPKSDAVEIVGEKPKTNLEKRRCCLPRTDLPKYNGFRSEYGLSAEQLQERRKRTMELRQQRRIDKIKKRQEEIRRRKENEESFSRWLHSKRRGAVVKRQTHVDTLSRSDVYIQTHAVYASGVSYSVDYSIRRKSCPKPTNAVVLGEKAEKAVNLDNLFYNVSPHVKGACRIYAGNEKK